jgi:hypothetical protein
VSSKGPLTTHISKEGQATKQRLTRRELFRHGPLPYYKLGPSRVYQIVLRICTRLIQHRSVMPLSIHTAQAQSMHASPAPTRLLRGCNILSAQCVYWCKDKVLTRRRSDNQLLLVPVSWLSSSRMVSSWQQTHLVHLQYPIYIAHIFMPVRSFLRLSCAVQGRPAFTSRRHLDSNRCRRRYE